MAVGCVVGGSVTACDILLSISLSGVSDTVVGVVLAVGCTVAELFDLSDSFLFAESIVVIDGEEGVVGLSG